MMKIFLLFLIIGSVFCLDKQRDCKCRLSSSSRIVGGSNSSAAYPFYVSIFKLDDIKKPSDSLRRLMPDDVKVDKFQCSGIILNEEFILTTATCAVTYTSSLNISFGSTDLVELFDTSREIEKVIAHPLFSYDQSLMLPINDLALIKLSEKIQFTDKVGPACLDSQTVREYNVILKAIGHGHDKVVEAEMGATPPTNKLSRVRHLKEADFVDLSVFHKKCTLKKAIICISSGNKNDSVCDGDQGSPLMKISNGRTSVVGLVSFPGVYFDFIKKKVTACTGTVTSFVTRLSEHFDWIEQHVQKNYCDINNI